VAAPELLRDSSRSGSYNCDALSLAGAAAALEIRSISGDASQSFTTDSGSKGAGETRFPRCAESCEFCLACHASDRSSRSSRIETPQHLVRYMDYGAHGDGCASAWARIMNRSVAGDLRKSCSSSGERDLVANTRGPHATYIGRLHSCNPLTLPEPVRGLIGQCPAQLAPSPGRGLVARRFSPAAVHVFASAIAHHGRGAVAALRLVSGFNPIVELSLTFITWWSAQRQRQAMFWKRQRLAERILPISM